LQGPRDGVQRGACNPANRTVEHNGVNIRFDPASTIRGTFPHMLIWGLLFGNSGVEHRSRRGHTDHLRSEESFL
jgi:hypothetical protein